jgi:hypothetical protein
MADLSKPLTEEEAALGWHDLVCPDREKCNFREIHGKSNPLVGSGLLEQFFDLIIERRNRAFLLETTPVD